MQAAANALPMPASEPSLANRWLKANLLAALTIPVTAGVLPVVANRMFPGLPDATFAWISAAVSFVAVVVCLTVYAMLTGSVLREKLPAFSRNAWITGHVAFATIVGLLMAKAELVSVPNSAWSWYTSGGPLEKMNFLLAIVVVVPLAGALLGGLQALALRNAVRDTRAWIVAFAIGSTSIATVSGVNFGLTSFPVVGDLTFVAGQSIAFAWVMLLAVIMLPAFNRLTPNT